MAWMTVISVLAQLALQVVRYLQGRQAIDTAAAKQLEVLLQQVNDLAAQIKDARNNPDASQPAIVHDPFNLDGSSLPPDAEHPNPPASPNGKGT